jgi:hypothetical protein
VFLSRLGAQEPERGTSGPSIVPACVSANRLKRANCFAYSVSIISAHMLSHRNLIVRSVMAAGRGYMGGSGR